MNSQRQVCHTCRMKTALYLIQARAGLPQIYECLRTRSFLLLSYKEETPDTTIFAPTSTWNVGRNLLREHVISQNLIFDYYVFLDEDVVFLRNTAYIRWTNHRRMFQLQCDNDLAKSQLKQEQEAGFNSLEASLVFGYPIVTMYHRHGNRKHSGSRIRKMEITRKIRYNARWPLKLIPSFDAMLTGISHKYFFDNRILPYEEKYDSILLWCSQIVLMLKASYYGIDIVMNTQYKLRNLQHSYPYFSRNSSLDWPTIVLKVYKETCEELGVPEIPLRDGERVSCELPYPGPVKQIKRGVLRWIIHAIEFCKFSIGELYRWLSKINRVVFDKIHRRLLRTIDSHRYSKE